MRDRRLKKVKKKHDEMASTEEEVQMDSESEADGDGEPIQTSPKSRSPVGTPKSRGAAKSPKIKKHAAPVFDATKLGALTRVVDRLKDLNLARLHDALEKEFDFCNFDDVKEVDTFLRNTISRCYQDGSANQSNATAALEDAMRKEESVRFF